MTIRLIMSLWLRQKAAVIISIMALVASCWNIYHSLSTMRKDSSPPTNDSIIFSTTPINNNYNPPCPGLCDDLKYPHRVVKIGSKDFVVSCTTINQLLQKTDMNSEFCVMTTAAAHETCCTDSSDMSSECNDDPLASFNLRKTGEVTCRQFANQFKTKRRDKICRDSSLQAASTCPGTCRGSCHNLNLRDKVTTFAKDTFNLDSLQQSKPQGKEIVPETDTFNLDSIQNNLSLNSTRPLVFILSHDQESAQQAKISFSRFSWAVQYTIPLSFYFETYFYSHIVSSIIHSTNLTSEWIGSISWKAERKTKIAVIDMMLADTSVTSQYDVLGFYNLDTQSNLWKHAESSHPPIFLKLLEYTLLSMGESMGNITIMKKDTFKSFYGCYFVTRPRYMLDYARWIRRVVDFLEADDKAQNMLWTDSQYAGGDKSVARAAFGLPFYPLHPFLGERLVQYYFNSRGFKILTAEEYMKQKSRSKESSEVYKYNICNGLSNQLLYHSASIAWAIEHHKAVQVPNYFIVNGAQTTEKDVLPSPSNSIPFGSAFDAHNFIVSIENMGIRVSLVDFDFEQVQLPCAGMQSLSAAKPELVTKVLQAFRPSPRLQNIVESIINNTRSLKPEEGLCLHHRDGDDWHSHCKRWASIQDGVYRGNCLGVPNRSFIDSLQDRAFSSARWVYYCGDHDVPVAFTNRSSSSIHVFRHSDILDHDGLSVMNNFERDLRALIDFFVCNELQTFVGNSVSTFSAIQIALRRLENSYWYNSQSIPLAGIWNVFQIPIVYTYTEMSSIAGKLLLQTSISSVRRHMQHCAIHILYDGAKDHVFIKWLRDKNVIIHHHDPNWRRAIETMRLSGDASTSHLFLHEGSYFGTWQRIDIPIFLKTEYCLLLDSDTLVLRPFSLADFGLNMTYGIAMSAEEIADSKPWNAGVMLMNIPKLRQTYDAFLSFINTHARNATFKNGMISDQGAYLEFYETDVRFLDREFNFKPYWDVSTVRQDPFILHFHGAKPHDYMKFLMGQTCDKAFQSLCARSLDLPFLCDSMVVFAVESKSLDTIAYCQASFENKSHARFCQQLLEEMAEKKKCDQFLSIVRKILKKNTIV